MRGIITWRELSDRGLWDHYCEITDADYWQGTPAEGADPDREIVLEQHQLLALGLITQEVASLGSDKKLPDAIHQYGCICDGCYSDKSVSLGNATAHEMEAMLAGKIRNDTSLEFAITTFRGHTIKIESASKAWVGNGNYTAGEEDGQFYMLSWDVASNSSCRKHAA